MFHLNFVLCCRCACFLVTNPTVANGFLQDTDPEPLQQRVATAVLDCTNEHVGGSDLDSAQQRYIYTLTLDSDRSVSLYMYVFVACYVLDCFNEHASGCEIDSAHQRYER